MSVVKVVKPKRKSLLWPIATDENNTISQSELEANTCNRRQARENACERDTISFGLASHWLTKWRQVCQPIIEPSKAKPKQTRNNCRHSIENSSICKSNSVLKYSQQEHTESVTALNYRVRYLQSGLSVTK